MTIREMEQQVGITKANIRFYEKEGLLSPARADNNYRSYTEEDRKTLEKIKYLRMLGIPVSDIRRFERGEAVLCELLDEREKQLMEEAAELERLRNLCAEIRQREWDFQSFDTELLTIKMKFLEKKGARQMRMDQVSFLVKLKNVIWFLTMCGIVSLLFFPVNEVLRLPVSGIVMTLWTSAVTILAVASLTLYAAAGEMTEEERRRKQEKEVARGGENRRFRYEKQAEGINQLCLASLVIIPINRMLEIQWPAWLTFLWFVAVFGSAIAVAVVKNR